MGDFMGRKVMGGVNVGEVAIWDEDRRTWGNEGCVGDTWIVVGES